MYQVKNGDYAQTIALLDAQALQKFREESASSLLEHKAHATSTPASYTVLTAHGARVADDEQSRRAVAEDEARFNALRERSLNHKKDNLQFDRLNNNTKSSAKFSTKSSNKTLTNSLNKACNAVAIVFAVICFVAFLPSISSQIDPTLIVFCVIACVIVGIGLAGKKRRR